MMTARELVCRCVDIAENYKTVYMWGCVGSPVTRAVVESRARQYPAWYTAAKRQKFDALVGAEYWGFDCVNLIKAVLWGWHGDRGKTYGGAQYGSNGVPDVSANGMIGLCRGVTTDFTREPPVGAALWCEGHIGVYAGCGLAVECTPAWGDGVQVTAVRNLGGKAGYHARQWTKWGLLPWVEYESENTKEELEMTKEELLSVAGTGDRPSAWAREAVAWAKAHGIVNGDGEGNYGWQQPITREALVTVLHHFKEYLGK